MIYVEVGDKSHSLALFTKLQMRQTAIVYLIHINLSMHIYNLFRDFFRINLHCDYYI